MTDQLTRVERLLTKVADSLIELEVKCDELILRRQLLNFVLQNPRVEARKLVFETRKPFDTIANVKGYPIGLRG